MEGSATIARGIVTDLRIDDGAGGAIVHHAPAKKPGAVAAYCGIDQLDGRSFVGSDSATVAFADIICDRAAE